MTGAELCAGIVERRAECRLQTLSVMGHVVSEAGHTLYDLIGQSLYSKL